jgi:regulation of enolase protein 1 (concanavalin A-like superfamily)
MRMDLRNGTWLNQPKSWHAERDRMTLTTDERTDFWRKTHYGFIRDSGHFLAFPVEGSFTATMTVRGRFSELYDQAGMMLRIYDGRWIKAGVEFSDGERYLSAVVTNGRSDWSLSQPFKVSEEFHLRMTLKGNAVRIQASADAVLWSLIRLAPFPPADRYLVGPMACTPERSGLTVEFSDFDIGPAIDKGLHDLT